MKSNGYSGCKVPVVAAKACFCFSPESDRIHFNTPASLKMRALVEERKQLNICFKSENNRTLILNNDVGTNRQTAVSNLQARYNLEII